MTTYVPAQRGAKWTREPDGILTAEKQYEDIVVDPQDWTDFLAGRTIASTAWTADGITLNSHSNTTTTTTATVTGIGSLHVDLTLSDGSTHREYFRWRRLNRPIGLGGGGGSLPGEDYRS